MTLHYNMLTFIKYKSKTAFYFLMVPNNTLMVIPILMESSCQQVQCLELLKKFLSVQEVSGTCLLWEIHCVFLKIFRYIDIDTKRTCEQKRKTLWKTDVTLSCIPTEITIWRQCSKKYSYLFFLFPLDQVTSYFNTGMESIVWK